MNLSNKILIGFFGFIFMYLTAVFAEVRFRGTLNALDDTNSIAETVDIPGLAYLVLQDLDENIHVIGSDHPRLEIRSLSGDWLRRLNYSISGDTLTLSQLQAEDIRTIRITVFVPESGLKKMTVNDAIATVEGLDQELLSISQTSGRIWMSGSRVGRIHLEAFAESHLNYSAAGLDTLSVTLDDSRVMISSPVGLLRGSMKNNSILHLSDVDDIQFRKDEGSTFNLYR